jgi:transcriptional regulator with XRE-family HTH domain
MTLREKLIVLRDKAGITQMALAHQLGVSRQAVTRWESGETAPSMDKLKMLAKVYDVSLDWLCSDANDVASEPQREVNKAVTCEAGTDKKGKSDSSTKKPALIIIGILMAILVLIIMCSIAGKKQDSTPDTWVKDMEQDESNSSEVGSFDIDW